MSNFVTTKDFSWVAVFKNAAWDWVEDKAPQHGAALAFYSIFSIAPLLVIALAIAGMFLDLDSVHTHLHQQLDDFLGADGAKLVESMLTAANEPKKGTLAVVVGIGAMVLGATGVFLQMQDALNTIWEVEAKPAAGVWGFLRNRLLSFAMILAIGFLLLVSTVISTALAGLSTAYRDYLPGPDWIAHIVDILVSIGVTTILFAAIFKYLPDVRIAWNDVWFGALITGILFVLGKWAIGFYLGTASVGSAYGSAGSLVIVLLWAYYSAQIFFFGAELTQSYATLRGSNFQPIPQVNNSGKASS
jgi:membrane protein